MANIHNSWQWRGFWVLPFLLLLAACGNGTPAISVGAAAPDFRLADAAGAAVTLSDFSGQPVLLYFHMAVG